MPSLFASPSGGPSSPPSSGSSSVMPVRSTLLTFLRLITYSMRSPLVPVPVSALPFSLEIDEDRPLEVRLVERHQGRGRRWRQRRIGAGVVADRLRLRPLGARGRLVVVGAGGDVGRGESVIALERPGLADIEQTIEVVVAIRTDQLKTERVAQQ